MVLQVLQCLFLVDFDSIGEWIVLTDLRVFLLLYANLLVSPTKLQTNPLDVVRNRMFQTNYSLCDTVRHLYETEGWRFLHKGLGKNMVAVAM